MAELLDLTLNSNLWHLERFNIFENFNRDELEAVTCILHLAQFGKRELIVLPSDQTRRIYFLIKGKAKLSRIHEEGRELILEILRPGEVFGQISFPKEHYSDAIVVALEECLVGRIQEDNFFKLMKKIPDLCLAINKVIGSRLLKIETHLEKLLFRDVPCRLARLLLRLADEFPHKLTCGMRIDLILTQQELVNLVGSSLAMVSMTLNRFRRSGWIDVHRRYICLHDLQAVKALAA